MKKDKLSLLRIWFVIHFVVDLLVALPLFLAPRMILDFFGMGDSNIVLVRIIAAALMAIGTESFLGRKSGRESYLGMLRLKIIWSAFVIFGLLMGFLNNDIDLLIGGILLGIFTLFNFIWVYWFLKLTSSQFSQEK